MFITNYNITHEESPYIRGSVESLLGLAQDVVSLGFIFLPRPADTCFSYVQMFPYLCGYT